MLEENYVISITGKQKIDKENDEIELTTCGTYTKKGGKRYIVYNEYDKENPAKKTKSVLKIEKGKVILIKGNDMQTRLILEEGKRNQCFYATDVGTMIIGVFTDKIDEKLDDNGGTLEIKYSLDINAGLTSYNNIFIEVKKGGSM